MTSKKKSISTPGAALVPMPTMGETSSTNFSHPLDFRSTISDHLAQDATTILVAVPSNTQIPDATNSPVDTTEALKIIFFDIA